MSCGLCVVGCVLQATDCGLCGVSCELCAVSCRLLVVSSELICGLGNVMDCELWVVCCGVCVVSCGLCVMGCELWAVIYKMWVVSWIVNCVSRTEYAMGFSCYRLCCVSGSRGSRDPGYSGEGIAPCRGHIIKSAHQALATPGEDTTYEVVGVLRFQTPSTGL